MKVIPPARPSSARRRLALLLLAAAAGLAACETLSAPSEDGGRQVPETHSLSGEPLHPPALDPKVREQREAELEQAKQAWDERPDDADALIWYGRRLAYLGRYREAVEVFTRGIALHPSDPRMYRHRGHRWITLRRFDQAESDLEEAARLVEGRPDEEEPPGLPNARGVALDTLNHSVFYHLALARYLQGDLERALPAWRECMRWSKNPDSLCSVTHWTYMTLRRLGRDAEARELLEPIRADLDIVEYHAYHRLCLAYRGEMDVDELWDEARAAAPSSTDGPTIGYGVGNWHLYNGRGGLARGIFREVAQAPMWPAFGRIAAEAELAGVDAD